VELELDSDGIQVIWSWCCPLPVPVAPPVIAPIMIFVLGWYSGDHSDGCESESDGSTNLLLHRRLCTGGTASGTDSESPSHVPGRSGRCCAFPNCRRTAGPSDSGPGTHWQFES
jgi:hypothetical protein